MKKSRVASYPMFTTPSHALGDVQPLLAEIIPPKILPRALKRFDLVTLYFALIFGSYGAAQMAAQGWAAIPMLLLAAVTCLLPCALASLELGTLFPGEGGIYIWAHKTLGAVHGFIAGWLSWVPIFLLLPLGANTVVAHLQIAVGYEFPLWGQILTQLIVVYGVTIVSLLRLKASQGYIRALFFVSFGTALVALIAGLLHGAPATPIDQEIFSLDLNKYGALYSAAVLWLLGVEIPFNMGSEFKTQKKASAKTMILWGSVILLVGYLAGIVGILFSTPKDMINATTGVALAAKTLFPWLGAVMALAISFAVTSQGVAYMNTYSRLLFISGIERRLPVFMGRVTERTRVPVPALLVQALGVTIVILFFSIQSQLTVAYNVYLAALVAVWCVSLYYLFFGIIIARQRFSQLYQANTEVWRIPGGKIGVWVCALWGIIFNTVAIYYVFALPWTTSISTNGWRSWLLSISFLIIGSGGLIYLLSRKRVASLRLEEELKRYVWLEQPPAEQLQ